MQIVKKRKLEEKRIADETRKEAAKRQMERELRKETELQAALRLQNAWRTKRANMYLAVLRLVAKQKKMAIKIESVYRVRLAKRAAARRSRLLHMKAQIHSMRAMSGRVMRKMGFQQRRTQMLGLWVFNKIGMHVDTYDFSLCVRFAVYGAYICSGSTATACTWCVWFTLINVFCSVPFCFVLFFFIFRAESTPALVRSAACVPWQVAALAGCQG